MWCFCFSLSEARVFPGIFVSNNNSNKSDQLTYSPCHFRSTSLVSRSRFGLTKTCQKVRLVQEILKKKLITVESQ